MLRSTSVIFLCVCVREHICITASFVWLFMWIQSRQTFQRYLSHEGMAIIRRFHYRMMIVILP